MIQYMNITSARDRLTSIDEEFDGDTTTISITSHGKPKLALMSWTMYESILETIEILGDAELMENMRQSIADVKEGRLVSLEELRQEFS